MVDRVIHPVLFLRRLAGVCSEYLMKDRRHDGDHETGHFFRRGLASGKKPAAARTQTAITVIPDRETVASADDHFPCDTLQFLLIDLNIMIQDVPAQGILGVFLQCTTKERRIFFQPFEGCDHTRRTRVPGSSRKVRINCLIEDPCGQVVYVPEVVIERAPMDPAPVTQIVHTDAAERHCLAHADQRFAETLVRLIKCSDMDSSPVSRKKSLNYTHYTIIVHFFKLVYMIL